MGPTLTLMPGTINLTLLGPGLGPGPGGGPWDPNGTGPWDPGAHQTPNPNPKTHAWHDKPHILYVCTGTDFLEDSPCIEKLHTSHAKIAFFKESVVFPG